MKPIRIAVLFAVCYLVWGCGSRSTQVRKYYLLENKSPLDLELMGVYEPFAYNADLKDFVVTAPYEDQRIPLRSESNELIYYYYHYWGVRPGEAVTQMVQDIFTRGGIFKKLTRNGNEHADVVITGEISAMERVRVKKAEFAHLAGRMIFKDGRTGQILVNYDFDRRVELKKNRSMNAFAETISKALFDETEEFIFRVTDYYLYPQAN